jgi:hypothetical protein
VTGVTVLGPVDASKLATWISAIDFNDWPQQSFTELKPAMVTDLEWHGFGAVSDPVVKAIMAEHFGGLCSEQRMLSVVMPGHSIRLHVDLQAPYWRCRVHVPLIGNDKSSFWSGDTAHVMEPGLAYTVDTMVEHAVENRGDTPRVHFMFDVRRP